MAKSTNIDGVYKPYVSKGMAPGIAMLQGWSDQFRYITPPQNTSAKPVDNRGHGDAAIRYFQGDTFYGR